jgi:hypothetical protein
VNAVILANVSSRAVFRRVPDNKIHFAETRKGILLVCLESLPFSALETERSKRAYRNVESTKNQESSRE